MTTSPITPEMVAIMERAAEDFEQRNDNSGDYPQDSAEWCAYVMVYHRLKVAAVAEGTAVR